MPARKVTDEQVREIRSLYVFTTCLCCGQSARPSLEELGERFGISAIAIFKIVKGQSYKRVEQ